jgi:hypothetical protein
MASLIEELIARQSQRQAPQAIQSDVGGMIAMLAQGNSAAQPSMNVENVLYQRAPQVQQPHMPDMGYGGGSGAGKSIISNLLDEFFTDRKDKKLAEQKQANNAITIEHIANMPEGLTPIEQTLYLLQGNNDFLRKLGGEGFNEVLKSEIGAKSLRAGTPGQWMIPSGSKPYQDEYGMTGYIDKEGNIFPNRFAETVYQRNMLNPDKRAAVEQAVEGKRTRLVEDPTGSSQVMTNDQAMGRAPLSVRNNNPGNIRPTGENTGFNTYETPEDGLKAIDENLKAYGSEHGINTLAGVISRWAPPNENDTARLISDASKRLGGLDPDKPIDLGDPVVRHAISGALVQQEAPVFVKAPIRSQTPAEKETSVLPAKVAFETEKKRLSVEEAKQKELDTKKASIDNPAINQAKQRVSDIITKINDSYNNLDKYGVIQNPKKGVIDNLGAGALSSDMGQFLSNKLGTEAASERNSIDSARSTLVPMIMKSSGLTGTQINSEAELRQFLKSLTDPKNDIQSVRKQLDNLDKLYGTGTVFKDSQPLNNLEQEAINRGFIKNAQGKWVKP